METIYSQQNKKMILYGMTARNFKERFNMTSEEAEDFVNKFKSSLPTLFSWVSSMEAIGERQGYVNTLFGRPRRVKSWFDSGDWSWVNFAKRTCINSAVQGTGADILKIVMIRLFKTFYDSNKPYTELIRFKNTIHDEINYQIIKDKEHNHAAFNKILKETMKIMRLKLPDWPFPMEVGLSIGNRWGQSVDFEFDTETLDVTGPKGDIASSKDICNGLGIDQYKKEEVVELVEQIDENMYIEY